MRFFVKPGKRGSSDSQARRSVASAERYRFWFPYELQKHSPLRLFQQKNHHTVTFSRQYIERKAIGCVTVRVKVGDGSDGLIHFRP